jgi:hypothetical protein
VNINNKALAWHPEEQLLVGEDNRPLSINGAWLIKNLIYFHLITEPGTYQPATNLGLGILRRIGQVNNETQRRQLQKDINDYFRLRSEMFPYYVDAVVEPDESDPHTLYLRLYVRGPAISQREHLLLSIKNGRISYIDEYQTENQIDLPESTIEIRSGSVENPFLARPKRKAE